MSAAASFRPPTVRAVPRAAYLTTIRMLDEEPEVKITIRKPKELSADELLAKLRASRSSTDSPPPDAQGGAPPPGDRGETTDVFVKVGFKHVKKSLGTFLKFWLMAGPGAKGWAGTGELEAQHTSGTQASIEVCEEQATVTLLSKSEPTHNRQVQLGRYAAALFEELEALASTEEAAPADRLCYPPDAVDAARATLPPPRP